MGRFIGAELPRKGSLALILAVAFSLGFATTLAEPDVLVLAGQAERATQANPSKPLLVCVIAGGLETERARADDLFGGLSLTQIGEFSYILGKVGLEHGLITRAVYDAILGTSLLTILLNAVALRQARCVPMRRAVCRASS